MAFTNVNIAAASSGDNTILNVTTWDLTRVYAFNLTGSGTVTAILKDEAGNTFGTYYLIAGSSVPLPTLANGAELFIATGDIIINLSGATGVGGNMIYQRTKQA